MKVAYCMRVDVFDKPGGDSFQIQEYIRAGREPGPDGKAMFEGQIIADMAADLTGFDIIHLTNIDRPMEAYNYFWRARAAGKPVVMSSIHHSFSEINRYEREGRGGIIGLISGALGFEKLECMRSLVRSIAYPQLLLPTAKLAFRGVLKSQVAIIEGTDRIFVLTNKEQEDIVVDFGVVPDGRFQLLRNGLRSSEFSSRSGEDSPRIWDVCVVARIEARKNQIAILNALNKLQLKAAFVGGDNKNHKRFCDEFKKLIATSQSEYLGKIPYEQVSSLMRSARIHVSASWFEVSSLVDLEAFLCDCFVVSSACGGTREVLGESAVYVDPSSEGSIVSGIASAVERAKAGPGTLRPPDDSFSTWDEIGIKLSGHYRAVLAEVSTH